LNRLHWGKIAVAPVALAGLIVAGCGGGAGNLAVVDGQPISMEDFNAYLQRKPSVQVVTNQGVTEARVASTLGFQGLRDMVNRTVLMQVAKDDGVFPTQADVQQELDFQTKRRPTFVQDLTKQGLSLSMIKQDLLLDLCRERVLTKGITVTDADVEKYIKETPQQFREPELADLYWIVINDGAKRAQIEKELQSGRPFSIVATQYSSAPNARSAQGKYALRIVDQMPARLQQLVRETKEGGQTPWLQDGTNYVKFFIQKKTPARPITIDDTIKTLVRRQIAMQRGQQANDLGQRVRDKLKNAKIEVQLASLKEPWKEAFDRLLDEDQSATTSTQNPGGATGGGTTGGGTTAEGATK
jgi:foldase protein PrsA